MKKLSEIGQQLYENTATGDFICQDEFENEIALFEKRLADNSQG